MYELIGLLAWGLINLVLAHRIKDKDLVKVIYINSILAGAILLYVLVKSPLVFAAVPIVYILILLASKGSRLIVLEICGMISLVLINFYFNQKVIFIVLIAMPMVICIANHLLKKSKVDIYELLLSLACSCFLYWAYCCKYAQRLPEAEDVLVYILDPFGILEIIVLAFLIIMLSTDKSASNFIGRCLYTLPILALGVLKIDITDNLLVSSQGQFIRIGRLIVLALVFIINIGKVLIDKAIRHNIQ